MATLAGLPPSAARFRRCALTTAKAPFCRICPVEEQIEVHDPAHLAAYHDQASAALAAHSGRYRVYPHEPVTVLEGAWHPAGIGILEFPTLEQARAWWTSPAFASLRQTRQTAAHHNTVLVTGIDDPQPQGAERACFALTERLAGTWDRDDPELQAYVDANIPLMERHGGAYRAYRTQPSEVLEGRWRGHDQGLTLTEFADRAQALAWYDYPDYRPWRALRQAHNTNQIVLCGR
jgi:uncharacterized protein (DUF1330 family)